MKTQIINQHPNVVGVRQSTELQSPATPVRFETKKRTKTMILTIVSAALLSVLPNASAQQSNDNSVATNLPGATTFIAPPSGFNPLTASDGELAAYGFPPRPDRNLSAHSYAAWERAMKASKERVFPVLELTNHFNGQNIGAGKTRNGTQNSYNWSGIVNTTTASSYGSTSIYWVATDFVIPVANQAYGSCTGGWDYESSWIGIDGSGSSDVLQAGTESDAYCGSYGTAGYYSAWYEWYPYGAVRITSLPVTAGDDMYVEVWSTSSTQGYAYVVNYDTNQAVVIGMSAPSGVHLVGNSAEWIVERPSIGGGLATLTNYIYDYFSSGDAMTFGGTYYPPSSGGAIQVTMVDGSGNPISYPTVLGTYGILLQDEGSAR